jgi:hypothetical protein
MIGMRHVGRVVPDRLAIRRLLVARHDDAGHLAGCPDRDADASKAHGSRFRGMLRSMFDHTLRPTDINGNGYKNDYRAYGQDARTPLLLI